MTADMQSCKVGKVEARFHVKPWRKRILVAVTTPTSGIWLLLLIVFLAGCSRDPLSEARAQKQANADHWLLRDGNKPDQKSALFSLKAKNSFDTPDGSGTPILHILCGESGVTADMSFAKKALENSNVRVSFDGSGAVDQSWDGGTTDHSFLIVPDESKDRFLRALTNSKSFDIEFTPRGGTAQRATFAVLNLRELMNGEASCRSGLAEAQNPGSMRQKNKGWETHRFKIGGEDQVVLILNAKDTIHIQDNDSTASLNLVCGMGSLIFIAAPPPQNNSVKVAYDGSAPVQEKWQSTSQTMSPSSLDARRHFLVQLLGSKTFSFEYTPRGGATQSSSFDLQDLKDIVNREKTCESWVHPQY